MTHAPVKERMTTIGEGGKRFWLYPASFRGLWLRRRQATAVALILFFFALPWTSINGQQTILLDIYERKFVIFGLVFWPQDTVIFWFFLVGSVVLIFLITAQWGRLWCGWACPQTVFLEHVFRKIEIWIEGDANKRRRLDRGPWTFEKFRKKGLKWLAFLVISAHFANTAVSYFVGTDNLIHWTFRPPAENPGWFAFMCFLTFVFFLNFAWFREQFCLIACPYGRFQSVLLDGDSMIVGYDYNRGEPRAPLRKNQARSEGDCIDCKRCVAVCPTGIDIRMGLQMECINCTACMDACDEIMDRVGKPRKLIGYTSQAMLEGRPRRFLRFRTLAYGALFVALWSFGGYLLTHKQDLIIRLVRPSGDSFTMVETEGLVTNHFQAKAVNKTDRAFTLTPRAPEGFEVIAAFNPWVIPPQETMENQVFVRKKIDDFDADGKETLTLAFYNGDTLAYDAEVTLMGPAK